MRQVHRKEVDFALDPGDLRQGLAKIHLSMAGIVSKAFGGRCREAGVRPSMGSVGDAYDNAMCESFFATPCCRDRSLAGEE